MRSPSWWLLFPLLAACSSTPGGDGVDPPRADASASGTKKDAGADASGSETYRPLLTVLPADVFSGFDGAHTFKAPISVYGGQGVTLTASDPSIVGIEPAKATAAADQGESFLLTMKKAGKVTLTATAGASSVTAQLTVTQYTAASWTAGEARYKSGGGGAPACTQCHNDTGVDHSPTAIAAAPDQEVMAVITTGILRDQPIRGVQHRWQEDQPVLDGLVTYLRALPPRGYTAR